MEYNKESLIKEAIKRLEVLNDTLKDCQETLISAHAERDVVQYLLWLGCEKE